MRKLSISKIGMIASIATGFLLAFAHLLEEAAQNDTWIIVAKNMILIAHLAMVFSFVAIYESDSSKNGWRAAGMLLATVGTILVSVIIFVEAASVSMPDATRVLQAVGVSWVTAAGPLLFVLGMLLIGTQLVLNGGSGGLLFIIGTVVFASADFVGPAGSVAIITGSALTGAGFVFVGVNMKKALR